MILKRNGGTLRLVWRLVAVGAAGLMLAATGCATTSLTDTSPAPPVGQVRVQSPIAAKAVVRPADGTLACDDLAGALRRADVFREIASAGAEAGEIEISVASASRSDAHLGAALLKGVATGLTFYATAGIYDQEYDYSITIRATLRAGGRKIADYEATGSRHLVMPLNFFPLEEKQRLVARAVRESWEHALEHIVAAIHADRPAIEAAIPGRAASTGAPPAEARLATARRS